jgi:hypothetical protein
LGFVVSTKHVNIIYGIHCEEPCTKGLVGKQLIIIYRGLFAMPAKIIAGDFAEGSTVVESWAAIQIIPLGLTFNNFKIDGQVQTVEIVTEQTKEVLLGVEG